MSWNIETEIKLATFSKDKATYDIENDFDETELDIRYHCGQMLQNISEFGSISILSYSDISDCREQFLYALHEIYRLFYTLKSTGIANHISLTASFDTDALASEQMQNGAKILSNLLLDSISLAEYNSHCNVVFHMNNELINTARISLYFYLCRDLPDFLVFLDKMQGEYWKSTFRGKLIDWALENDQIYYTDHLGVKRLNDEFLILILLTFNQEIFQYSTPFGVSWDYNGVLSAINQLPLQLAEDSLLKTFSFVYKNYLEERCPSADNFEALGTRLLKYCIKE